MTLLCFYARPTLCTPLSKICIIYSITLWLQTVVDFSENIAFFLYLVCLLLRIILIASSKTFKKEMNMLGTKLSVTVTSLMELNNEPIVFFCILWKVHFNCSSCIRWLASAERAINNNGMDSSYQSSVTFGLKEVFWIPVTPPWANYS